MAKEKMVLDRSVLESSSYMSLSDKAARLYVHLNLDADGMGAVRTTIPRMLTKTDERHLQELIDAGFLYELEGLEESVCLIVHWFAVNKLDRSKMHPGDYDLLIVERYGFDDASRRVYVPWDEPGCIDVRTVLKPDD